MVIAGTAPRTCWPRPLWNCFQNDTVRMGKPASDQVRRRHAGEFHDAAQLPVVFHRFRAVCRMRNPTQVSAHDTDTRRGDTQPLFTSRSRYYRAPVYYFHARFNAIVVCVCVCICLCVLVRLCIVYNAKLFRNDTFVCRTFVR